MLTNTKNSKNANSCVIQFSIKKGYLHTNMAIPDQKDDDGNIIEEIDMVVPHH